jgi:hypothetical protein
MKSNKKYVREQVYALIESWQKSGLTQKQFCARENLSHSTFKYWRKKYRINQERNTKLSENAFIPIKLAGRHAQSESENYQKSITITYPNGIEIKCPVNIAVRQLEALIKT